MKYRVNYLGREPNIYDDEGNHEIVDAETPQDAVRAFNQARGSRIYPGEHYTVAAVSAAVAVVTRTSTPSDVLYLDVPAEEDA